MKLYFLRTVSRDERALSEFSLSGGGDDGHTQELLTDELDRVITQPGVEEEGERWEEGEGEGEGREGGDDGRGWREGRARHRAVRRVDPGMSVLQDSVLGMTADGIWTSHTTQCVILPFYVKQKYTSCTCTCTCMCCILFAYRQTLKNVIAYFPLSSLYTSSPSLPPSLFLSFSPLSLSPIFLLSSLPYTSPLFILHPYFPLSLPLFLLSAFQDVEDSLASFGPGPGEFPSISNLDQSLALPQFPPEDTDHHSVPFLTPNLSTIQEAEVHV